MTGRGATVRRTPTGGLVLLGLIACFPSRLPAQEAPPTPAAALQRLREGNARFAADRPARKDLGSRRREELARGQHPFAVVLACADSRVAPEVVFDQGLGDLFVLRVAGNVTDPEILGSMEYAVEHLHVRLIVVLGHSKCGAVEAALSGKSLPGNLGQLVERVYVERPLPRDPQEALAATVRANARHQAEKVTEGSPVLKEFVARKQVRVVAGVYSLQSGKVEWLEDSPPNPKGAP